MQDDTKQIQEVKAKRTAKNSVFLDLFQDKKNLLALYKTLHPEDTDATEDMLDIVTISSVFSVASVSSGCNVLYSASKFFLS